MPRILVNLLQSTGTKGGIEVYARELYAHLGRRTTEFEYVGFASRELARTNPTWFPGEVIDSGISGENRITWALGELISVGRAARRMKVDLVHGPAMFGPLRTAVPTVISMHDLLYFTHPHLMQTRAYTPVVKWMERRGVDNATRLITISEVSATAIQRHLGVPRSRIDVIPLAGRSNALQPPAGLIRSDALFLSIGQRSPYKNFETVVRGWKEIPPAHRPQLVITGSHGDDPLAPLVRDLDLSDWVTLRDWVSTEELASLFGTATALIDSTLATGFSMPTLEAMSIGLPVLLADTEVFREVGADAAEYFTAGDPADLARAVTRLVSTPQRLGELTLAGEERARGFSWDRVATETLESFRSALAEPR